MAGGGKLYPDRPTAFHSACARGFKETIRTQPDQQHEPLLHPFASLNKRAQGSSSKVFMERPT